MFVPESLQSAHDSARLRVQLLGDFDARIGEGLEERPLDLRGRKADQILAYLLLRGGTVERADLSRDLWPGAASNPMDHGVRALRSLLEREDISLQTQGGRIHLGREGICCDAIEFDRLARRSDIESLQVAIALYTGPLVPAWSALPGSWFRAAKERREDHLRQALHRLIEDARQRNSAYVEIALLRRFVAELPDEEHPWHSLIRLLAETGERLEAIALYERYAQRMHGNRLTAPAALEALYRDLRGGSYLPPGEIVERRVGGPLPEGSPLYIQREADTLFFRLVEQRERIILVKGARETGKSSLLVRGLHAAHQRGSLTLLTDFHSFSEEDIASTPSLCRALIAQLAAQIESRQSEHGTTTESATLFTGMYREELPGTMNLQRFIERRFLLAQSRPVVWALDRVDRLFAVPHGRDLFSLIRTWHGKANYMPGAPWKRLTVVLTFAIEPRLYILDHNKSPFNVGKALELGDLDRAQVGELHQRFSEPLESEEAIDTLYALLGGHPYLTGQALELLHAGQIDFTTLLSSADREDGPFGVHLRRIREWIEGDGALQDAVRSTLKQGSCPESLFPRLRGAGLIVGESSAEARPRCDLYTRFLTARFLAD